MEFSVDELVTAVAAGDEDAFAELFRRMARQVRAASAGVLGNDLDTEDVVAEVFAEFWVHPEAFDPTRATLLGFLRLKAKGKSIDLLRSRQARVRREDVVGSGSRSDVPELDAHLLGSESSLEIHAALSLLPPREAQVIRLAFFNDMSYTEVAKAVGNPLGTVKSQIRSGLRRLASSIDGQNHRPAHRDESVGRA